MIAVHQDESVFQLRRSSVSYGVATGRVVGVLQGEHFVYPVDHTHPPLPFAGQPQPEDDCVEEVEHVDQKAGAEDQARKGRSVVVL
jgi:hypothetical protein